MKLFLVVLMFFLQPVAADSLKINDAWARATPPGAPMAAIYARFLNVSDQPITITRIQTDVAGLSEIHESIEIDGLMRMREVVPFIIKAGERVDLAPGGKHIMLMKMHHSLQPGSKFILSVTDDHEQMTRIEVRVGGFGQMDMPE